MAEFTVHRCLGRGGFGEVYRGVMSRGGGIAMDVAIKVLRPDLDPSSQGVQRLRDEGRLLGRLTHPTILRVYDLVVIEGRAALITEFVDGDDLAQVIRSPQRPGPRGVFEMVAQVAAALDAAWSWPSVTDGQPMHLVHRDIKPDNIRLDPHGVVKLLDFGIAQASSIEREAETSVNIIMGSAQYLAPERMVQQEVGPESDVFALGCTLYEALTGEALFHRKSMRQMYLLMVEAERYEAYIAERFARLDGLLDHARARALLRAMVAYTKSDRPTAGDVAGRCDTICEGLGGTTLRRWAREYDWPEARAAEPGPLEGRSFTSVMSLPAPEARTLALRADAGVDLREPPDLADSLTDPGFRRPVLGELTGDAPVAVEAEPWTGAELVALSVPPIAAPPTRPPESSGGPQRRNPSSDEDDADGPTVQVPLPPELRDELASTDALRAPAPAPTPTPLFVVPDAPRRGDPNATYPVFEFDDDTIGIQVAPPALLDAVDAVTDETAAASAPTPIASLEQAIPVDPGANLSSTLDETFDVIVDEEAVEPLLAQLAAGRATEAPVAAEPPLPASEPAAVDDAPPFEAPYEDPAVELEPPEPDLRVVDEDGYEPQPGDIDISGTFGPSAGDVRFRVAPPGATLSQRVPQAMRRKPKSEAANRVSVFVLSGTLGIFVGALIIGSIALVVWLVIG